MSLSPVKVNLVDYLGQSVGVVRRIVHGVVHELRLRLALPQPRSDYVRKSFSYNGAALWNIRVSKTF